MGAGSLPRWMHSLSRVLAAAAVIFTYFNNFIGRLPLAFAALAILCLLALSADIYQSRRNADDRKFLTIAAVTGGLFYLGKLILLSTSEWVVHLISPASIKTYHVPALIFVTSMIYPWITEKEKK